jgi:hypothetical protein
MQDADAWQFDVLPLGGNVHEGRMLCSGDGVTDSQCVSSLDPFVGGDHCVWEYAPESAIELFYMFQPRLDSLITVQDYIVGIETEIAFSPARIFETVEGLFEGLPIRHGRIVSNAMDLLFTPSA